MQIEFPGAFLVSNTDAGIVIDLPSVKSVESPILYDTFDAQREELLRLGIDKDSAEQAVDRSFRLLRRLLLAEAIAARAIPRE